MYSISRTSGCVYRLTLGALTGGSYHLNPGGYHCDAPDLRSFLEQLRTHLTEAVSAQRAARSRRGRK
ncbi:MULTISPECIES: hypothetical protein [Streptomyces]|uniref:Uncharacterized protein n=1 Tax=Streptomyces caniscabiei TaxID=2746961 RepID=A0ABU4N6I0_9ACTN|nr:MULTISPECIES: hypothetical protein [Streptomyces]MBE4741724.1 hypothetical protein [Streptomyces caniscabiei]MBE4762320.1 hypothetical protein [Streptomyces caniscabiei]MBE4775370.1 hypothetical protein [Streptomyces caniscabiei]MBE4788901.1 hypothetical protein [Streptomyces caniscabiei]MBE4799691.1 hypothetical protein [Streptomyces caniscabiei]